MCNTYLHLAATSLLSISYQFNVYFINVCLPLKFKTVIPFYLCLYYCCLSAVTMYISSVWD